MYRPETRAQAPQSVGVVERVDTVNRELTVLLGGDPLTIDVPVDCVITLHGERVKFRMVQPWDRVRVAHAACGSRLVARRIEVQPEDIR